MHRIVWLRYGNRRIHMLKLVGSFFILASILKVFESVYNIVLVMNKAILAQVSSAQATQLFGGCVNCTGPIGPGFSGEDLLGVMLGPIAALLFWLAVVAIGIMIYQSGKVFMPIENAYIPRAKPFKGKKR